MATGRRSEAGHRLAELLGLRLRRRRRPHRRPRPDRLDHDLGLYPGRRYVCLARVRLLVRADCLSVARAVAARGCLMAQRCPLARRPAAGLALAVCWARFPTARCRRHLPRYRGRVFGLVDPRPRPCGMARLAASGCWRDHPEVGLRRGVVLRSGLRRRSSRRRVAGVTARCVPRLLLAFPPGAPLWDLERCNQTDQPARPDPPRPPHPTRTFRYRSRQKGTRRIFPWYHLFCHFLSDFRTFRLNSSLSKLTVELTEDLFLPKRLYQAGLLRIPFVFRSAGTFCLNSIFRKNLWKDLFLNLFPCLVRFRSGEGGLGQFHFRSAVKELRPYLVGSHLPLLERDLDIGRRPGRQPVRRPPEPMPRPNRARRA